MSNRSSSPREFTPMTDEEWEKNKDCDKKGRDHKWYWKFDIASGMPSPDQAYCAHCGKETTLAQPKLGRDAKPL